MVLRLWPVHYDSRTSELRMVPRFKVRVAYSAAKVPTRSGVTGNQGSLARYLVANSKVVPTIRAGAKIDLMIAHNTYQTEFFRFIEFKHSRGRAVRAHFVRGKTEKEIKQIIDTEYQSAEPPTQTILVGNPAQIPAYPGTSDNTWTDYNYQLIGTDSIPDISLGRIPVSSTAELAVFLEKVMARETEPRNVGNVLLTAGKDTSLGCPANVTQVGENLAKGGSDIQITKRYKTTSSTEEVLVGYNSNPNLIVYDGHGNREGMTEIPLVILAAKIKHGQQDRSFWNYYGDPASSVWESPHGEGW